ncbi:MAG: hypothetical protein ACHQ01_07060, partial [Candidatus Limnocylindrales bacterium]
LLRVPYFESVVRKRLGDGYRQEAVAAMVVSWVQGVPYDGLASILNRPRMTAARAVRAVNEITSFLAWGAGSVVGIASADPEIAAVDLFLPYLIRFGVNTPVAAYLRLLGVSDRLGAIAIARRYPPDRPVTFEGVDAWARSEPGRAVIRDHYAENAIAGSATEHDLGFETDAARALPIFFSAASDHPTWIQPGSLVTLEPTGNGFWTARDLVSLVEWSLDTAPGPGISAITAVEDGRLRGVLFVPVDDQQPRMRAGTP